MNRKVTTIIVLSLLAVVVFMANILGELFFTRIDLTEDSRHTISPAMKRLFKDEKMNSPMLIKVYLGGEMPVKYRDMQKGIKDYIRELRVHAGKKLEYELIDPQDNEELMKEFIQSGHYPFKVVEDAGLEQTQKYILPYAKVVYKGKEETVNLIRGCVYQPEPGRLEIATAKVIQDLEYNLATNMYDLIRDKDKTIGVYTGHGEYGAAEMTDLFLDMKEYYLIEEVDTRNGKPIDGYDAVIIMQPDSALSERDKYEIDQYLMRGGKILWMLDNEMINFDIGNQMSTLTQLRQTNLDDMFLKWGIKLNYDIVQDQRCDQIQLTQSNPSFGGQMQAVPWVYHVQIGLFPNHPVTRAMDLVLMRFAASIDTFHTDGIHKEVLLTSSRYSRKIQRSQFIDIDEYVKKPIPSELFDKGPQIMAVELSGTFPSLFRNREMPVDSLTSYTGNTPQFLPQSTTERPAKMIIISDGEFGTGHLYRGQVQQLPYDNKDMVLNCLDYLTGQEVLTEVRSQAIKVRKLDPKKVENSKFRIALVNIILPVIFFILLGVAIMLLRWIRNKKHKQS